MSDAQNQPANGKLPADGSQRTGYQKSVWANVPRLAPNFLLDTGHDAPLPRPSLHFRFWSIIIAVLMMAGVILGEVMGSAGIAPAILYSMLGVAGCLIASALYCAHLGLAWRGWVAAIIGTVLLGMAGFGLDDARVADVTERVPDLAKGSFNITADIVESEHYRGNRQRVILRPIQGLAEWHEGDYLRLVANKDIPPLTPGERIDAEIFLSPLPSRLLPDGFDFRRHAAEQGIVSGGFLRAIHGQHPDVTGANFSRLRTLFQRRIFTSMQNEDAAAIASALLIGFRAATPSRLHESFRGAGLAHFLAISGLHMGLFCLASMVFMRGFLRVPFASHIMGEFLVKLPYSLVDSLNSILSTLHKFAYNSNHFPSPARLMLFVVLGIVVLLLKWLLILPLKKGIIPFWKRFIIPPLKRFLKFLLIPQNVINYFLPYKATAAFALPLCFLFLLFAGIPISALRAFLMLALVLVAILISRRGITIHHVALAAIVVLLADPSSLFTPAFQMSFSAVFALVVAWNTWQIYRPLNKPNLAMRVLGYVVGIAATSLIASLASMPFVLYHFGVTTSWSVVANILGMPLMAFIIMPLGGLALIQAVVGNAQVLFVFLISMFLIMCWAMRIRILGILQGVFINLPFGMVVFTLVVIGNNVALFMLLASIFLIASLVFLPLLLRPLGITAGGGGAGMPFIVLLVMSVLVALAIVLDTLPLLLVEKGIECLIFVADYFSSLPGARIFFPPPSAFITVCLAASLITLGIGKRYWRASAAVPLLLGLVLWSQKPVPVAAVVVLYNKPLLAVLADDGELVVNSRQIGDFAKRILASPFGRGEVQYIRDREDADCGNGYCAIDGEAGWRVAIVWDRVGLTAACREAHLVLSLAEALYPCRRGVILVDRRDIAASGGILIYPDARQDWVVRPPKSYQDE